MGLKISNNAYAVLAAGVASSDTSITLTAGQGARFPSLGGSDYFYATLVDTGNNLEIIKCTARSGDVLTVVRAQDGTTAKNYVVGDRIEIRPVAAIFDAKADTDYVDNEISTLDSGKLDYVAPGTSGNVLTSDGTNWISAALPVVPSNEMFTLLGTVNTPSGNSVSISGLDLTPYSQIYFYTLNVTGTLSSTTVYVNSNNSQTGFNFTASASFPRTLAIADFNESFGLRWASNTIDLINITSSTTQIYFRCLETRTFTGGSIAIYGVK
jgi:hypothetical protein